MKGEVVRRGGREGGAGRRQERGRRMGDGEGGEWGDGEGG